MSNRRTQPTLYNLELLCYSILNIVCSLCSRCLSGSNVFLAAAGGDKGQFYGGKNTAAKNNSARYGGNGGSFPGNLSPRFRRCPPPKNRRINHADLV